MTPAVAVATGPRILIIKLGAVGDLVHSLPVAHTLRRRLPDAFLAWAVEDRGAELLQGNPDLNEVLVLARRQLRGMAAMGVLRRFGAELAARRFTAVIDLHNLFKTGLLARASGAPVRIGFDKWRELNFLFMTQTVRPPPQHRHAVEKSLALLQPLGIQTADWEVAFPIPWSDADAARIELFLRQNSLNVPGGPLAINPGAAWPSKRWPPERYARVADELHQRHEIPVVILWGPGERRLAEAVAAAMTRPVTLACETTLKQAAALLARCRLLISGDTGPLHLAAAVGTRTVALFGPSHPERNGPYGSGHRIVASPRPPATHWQVKERGDHWMAAITVERVVAAAEEQLERKENGDRSIFG